MEFVSHIGSVLCLFGGDARMPSLCTEESFSSKICDKLSLHELKAIDGVIIANDELYKHGRQFFTFARVVKSLDGSLFGCDDDCLMISARLF